jgi:hypothetical protein
MLRSNFVCVPSFPISCNVPIGYCLTSNDTFTTEQTSRFSRHGHHPPILSQVLALLTGTHFMFVCISYHLVYSSRNGLNAHEPAFTVRTHIDPTMESGYHRISRRPPRRERSVRNPLVDLFRDLGIIFSI